MATARFLLTNARFPSLLASNHNLICNLIGRTSAVIPIRHGERRSNAATIVDASATIQSPGWSDEDDGCARDDATSKRKSARYHGTPRERMLKLPSSRFQEPRQCKSRGRCGKLKSHFNRRRIITGRWWNFAGIKELLREKEREKSKQAFADCDLNFAGGFQLAQTWRCAEKHGVKSTKIQFPVWRQFGEMKDDSA